MASEYFMWFPVGGWVGDGEAKPGNISPLNVRQ